MTAHRLPRALHPGAWWLWAASVALAASRVTNPLLLALLAAAAAFVVTARRQPSPWSHALGVFLRIALLVLVVRVVLFALLAPPGGGRVILRLPELPLPSWLAGVRLGGPVTVDGVLAATYDGMRLGVVLVCIGAANALTSPRRLLKSMPAALYEAGVAVTVALAFVPQAVAAGSRVQAARRLRGRTDRGPRAVREVALAVLEGALERSVDLAAAMDARGFGRRGGAAATGRRLTAVLTLTGLTGVLVSSYGLLDASAPSALGLPLLVGSAGVLAAGFAVGARRGGRSRYRPDPWRWPEWVTAGCGVGAAGLFAAVPGGLSTPVSPPAVPALPVLAVVAVGLVLLPAWVSPPLPAPRTAPATRAPAAAGVAP